jgi:sacsin
MFLLIAFESYRHKLKINNAVKYALENPTYSFDHSFEFGIERRSAGGTTNTKFVVHHSIQCGLMDETLRAWAKVQNYIPWVAVAAQLPVRRYSGSPCGLVN